MTEICRKLCIRCREVLPLDLFGRRRGSEDGHSNWCKACLYPVVYASMKKRRAEKIAAGVCDVCGKRKPRPGSITCTRCYQRARQYKRNLRLEVINHYGGQCACCKENRPEFLQIDHIGGGGTQHYRQLTGSIYGWLKQRGFPSGYRILCANCNLSLGFYGYCPHNPHKKQRLLPRGRLDASRRAGLER